MSPSSARLRTSIVLGTSLALFSACGGGGGGGSGGGGSSGFVLTDVKYGRRVDDGRGGRLVSPLTTASVDPITGLLVPGTLQALANGVDVAAPQTLALGPDYVPRVIPRNGVLQLEFSMSIDPASVSADEIDANGALVRDGSVQIRTEEGTAVPVAVTMRG